MGRLVLVFLFIFLNAKEYKVSFESIGESKKTACQKALDNAKEEALSQAGTLIVSDFSKSMKIDGDKYKSIKQKDLKSISIGVVKVISKKESVKITKDYNFICKVDAVLQINEKEVKENIQKYLNAKNKTTYIKAKGFSEEGQSRYRAIKAAILDAKRNLLEEIKSSKIYSQMQSKNGKLASDIVSDSSSGNIRFVKILSVDYDPTTKSATAVVGITKDNLLKNFQ